MIAIGTTGGNIQTIFGAVIVVHFRYDYPFKNMPFSSPIVTGSIITIIGISLLPVAIRWIMGGNPKAPEWGSLENTGIAALPRCN